MHVADDGASGGDLANSRVFTVLRLLATSSYHNYMQLCMCMLHLGLANLIACLAPWKTCYCMRAGGSFSLFIATSSSFPTQFSRTLNLFAKVSTLTTDQATIASYYRNAYKKPCCSTITARRANFAQLKK